MSLNPSDAPTTAGPAERYVVEWCSELPTTLDGDADIDRAKYERRSFSSFKAAVVFGKRILWSDCFGDVLLERREWRDIPEDDTHFRQRGWELTGVLHISDQKDRPTVADLERPS